MNVHEVMDHNVSVLSAVMTRVLILEQVVATTTAQMKQLRKVAEENDVTLDNALPEQLNHFTAARGEEHRAPEQPRPEREGHLGEDRPLRLEGHWDG